MKKIKAVFLAALLALPAVMAFAQDVDDATENHARTVNRFIRILNEQWGVDTEKISGETYFLKDFGADDLDVIELVMALEEDFDIEIPDDEWARVTTVDSAADLIIDRVENRFEYQWQL